MARRLLVHLWLAIGILPVAAFAGEVKLGDDITTGIQTRAEFEVRPFGTG
jgi:ABC-type proline/glycine betaine transport system permease subunit